MNIKQATIFKIKYLEMLIKQAKEGVDKATRFSTVVAFQGQIDYFEDQLKDLNNYLNDLKTK